MSSIIYMGIQSAAVAVVLRILIKDDIAYIVSCAVAGAVLGFVNAALNRGN